ncbi:hypothetical protein SNE40_021736 [Patella caerulea]|uniref:Serpin domain-containing protein n=1 Tax=Patella caerulea TaxID=87958 RepID=A0AAN8G521_PATCE
MNIIFFLTSKVKALEYILLSDLQHSGLFTLAMPKIKIENKLKLKQSLQGLGIQKVFDPSSADLSGITGMPGLFIGEAIQQAVIEIGESGTKAAAVTGFGIAALSSAIHFPRYITLNHPYMFVIRDKVAGVNLFHGRYTDPR